MAEQRVTQTPVESLTLVRPAAKVTQLPLEAFTLTRPNALVTQVAVEVLTVGTRAPARSTRRFFTT